MFFSSHSFIPVCLFLVAHLIKLVVADFVGISFVPNSLNIKINDIRNVSLAFSRPVRYDTDVIFTYLYGTKEVDFYQKHVIVRPLSNITISNGTSETMFSIEGVNAGSVIIGINITSPDFGHSVEESFVKVSVRHSQVLDVINAIIGWIYFAAWSISFYPQIIENWKRKSVVGLSFDFIAYNITGHLSYFLYNAVLFWSATVQAEYFSLHPRGVLPVQPNDVAFSMHAVLMCSLTILQCFMYESGRQSLSRVGILFLSAMWLFLFISLFVAVGQAITWLTLLNFFSYLKLAITLIKYIPQAWMNFTRKSTIGWSIGNVLLDFTGGVFSILQAVLIAYNSDDWASITADPAKFGLGLFSILFDVLFIVQHYCLYRSQAYLSIDAGDDDHNA